MRRRAVIAVVVAGLGLAACESSQSKSARLARSATRAFKAKGQVVTKANPDVEVAGTTVLHDSNGAAAVVLLENHGGDQAALPISIDVTGAGGKSVYRNDAAGLEPALVSIPYLRKGAKSFWVNNQLVATGMPSAVTATVGGSRGTVKGPVPEIEISAVNLGHDANGRFAKGRIVNRSQIEQKHLTVFCIARASGKVVAAGRAVIEKLVPGKPAVFTVFFIGDPSGAKLSFAAPPTVLDRGAAR